MPRAFIGLGSNTDPERNIAQSLRLLGQKALVIGVSTVYMTEPEGGRREQPSYFNCVAAIETDLPPGELKREVLRGIERQLDRRRSGDRFSARTCDLDLLLHGETAVRTQEMTLPDPHLADRPYLVQGLLELEPGLVLPGGDVRLAESACAAARAPLTSLPEKQSGLFNLAGMSYALPLDGGFDHGRQEVPYHQFRNLRPRRLQAGLPRVIPWTSPTGHPSQFSLTGDLSKRTAKAVRARQ